jgi:GAF domain-containing protein
MEERAVPAGRIDGKSEAYRVAVREIGALVAGEPDAIANLANAVAVLRERLGFFWVGVYRLDGGDLVLGPFQGTVACSRMAPGRGVCGAAAARGETILVPDVHAFPGHIACDARSRSEIVVPLRGTDGRLRGVLDVDSDRIAAFDDVDRAGLEAAAAVLAPIWEIGGAANGRAGA